MPWCPSEPDERPTLGWLVLDWISEFLAAPDRSEYEPYLPTPEQARFILRFYELDPATGRRRYRRAVLSRPKGWGKSPLVAAVACAEALGPVVPAGWDATGQPVGQPWSDLRTPWVSLAATSEEQTANAALPLLEMLRQGPVMDSYPGLEPLATFVNLPRGRIDFVTAAATSREGARPVFCGLDQTESWLPANGGVRLAATIRRNLAKTGGSSIETPNAYRPGENTVAEESAEYAHRISEGRARDDGLLYDHREAPADTDLLERNSLLAGLMYAYGDSAAPAGGWVDLDRIVAEIWDPATDPQDARAYYLGQITHASDAWVAAQQWDTCAAVLTTLADRDLVTLGFDGSVSEDATALVACRVLDGHLELLRCDERPEDATAGWQVDQAAMDAAVAAAFDRFDVVAFYADPPHWRDFIDKWTTEFGARLRVKASVRHPIEWWTNRPTAMVATLKRFHDAVAEARRALDGRLDARLTHGGDSQLRRHVLNARRRVSRAGIQVAKEYPGSSRKIDAAMAAVLAYEARGDAVAAGFARPRKQRRAVGF